MNREILKAIALLKASENIAIPTETVYGLAANAYDEIAIKKIFETKGRPLFNPLIVHIHSIDYLDKVANSIPPKAQVLAEHFWPGSLTLVLPKNHNIPDLVTAGKATVAVRVPNHPLTLELLHNLDFPLVAPSANPFGSISPTTAQHVSDYFQERIPLILDGGACQNGIESTIIGFEGDDPILYRLGALSLDEIESVIGKVKIKTTNEISPEAPGMLLKHYAPSTETIIVDAIENFIQNNQTKNIGTLTFYKAVSSENVVHQEIVSPKKNYKEAAAELYKALHRLDKMNLSLIVVERFPNESLGQSINDRLERATKK
ncbi:L-threonylcarbamoyladenylate synthase [Flavobacterium buctense]|uniref:Threonylcarbamoyl-AMP synthase n=1 Tax=Flavobacterium buctense TaxID=1648146 RepID=A0ABU9E2Q5_9FLAO|nr:L-threonylcarbamoyladenylate synthase [Flavobacterium buctense]